MPARKLASQFRRKRVYRRKKRVSTRAASREKTYSKFEKQVQDDHVILKNDGSITKDTKAVVTDTMYLKWLSPTVTSLNANMDRVINASKSLMYSTNLRLSFFNHIPNDQLLRVSVVELVRQPHINGKNPRGLFNSFWKKQDYTSDKDDTKRLVELTYNEQRFAKMNTEKYSVLGRRYVVIPGTHRGQITKSCHIFVPMKRNMDKDLTVNYELWHKTVDPKKTRTVQQMDKPVILLVEMIKNTGTEWAANTKLISIECHAVYNFRNNIG